LKRRWGMKVALLARHAGLSPHVCWQRARVAGRIPSDSPLRAMDLPFSILRLLAPLPDPLPWAAQARALQAAGDLHVRAFARQLADAGARRPPVRRSPRCLHCRRAVSEDPDRLFIRDGDTSGWLCSRPCALSFFEARASRHPAPIPAPAPAPDRQPPPAPDALDAPKRDSESQFLRCRYGIGFWRSRPRSAARSRPRLHPRSTRSPSARRALTTRRSGRYRPALSASRGRAPPASRWSFEKRLIASADTTPSGSSGRSGTTRRRSRPFAPARRWG
jgi:hypothetical protein